MGADFIIRYDQQSVGKKVKEITSGRGVDIIIEHPGQATWKESLRALKKGGKIITCGATTGPKVEIDLRALFIKHQQIIGSTMGTRKDIIELLDLIERGKFKPVIAREFTFDEVGKAHDFLESGQAFGKVVLINR